MPRIYRKKRRATKNKNSGKIVEQKTEYKIIEPQTMEEKKTRDLFSCLVNQRKKKKKNIPHCVVCGDTEEDGGMKKVDNTYFCDTCFMIQVNM